MLTVTQDKLEASVCKDSFYDFVQRFWDTIIAEDPVWNWHIEYLCEELQIMAERVFERKAKKYDLVINISPGSTKSTIASVMFPVWCWCRDASIRSICASYAFPLSLHLATQSRNVLQSDKFLRVFPEVDLVESQKGLLVNSKGGQRIATSTGGSITGMHGHFLILDDPVNPKEAASTSQLKAANEWIDQTLMTRKVDKRLTPLIMIMQRLHQADPTGHLLEKEGDIRHVCLPAELGPLGDAKVRPRRLRRKYVGGLMDPVRLSRKALTDSARDLGDYGYAGQFMQSPIPAGGGMFKTEEIQIEHSPTKLLQVVRYWDKAGTAAGGAFTVGAKLAVARDGSFWLLDVVRGQWEASERERVIEQTAAIDGRTVLIGVEQEPGSGGKESAQGTLRRLAGYRVIIDRPVGNKELRADPFAVQVNGGNVRMVRGEWNRDFLDELRFFPFSKYKDQVDSSSGAFALLTRPRRKIGVFK